MRKLSKSHIEQIFSNPYFKPYEGSEADEIFKKIKSHAKGFTDEQIRRAVESLSMLRGDEVYEAIKIQDKFCVKCGNCCRNSNPIDFLKEELRAVAKRYFGLSYKKLKHRVRAYPSRKVGGMGVIQVPGKPCPFLEGRNKCTIYDLRPMACRLYPLGKTLSCILVGKPVGLIKPEDCAVIGEVMVIFAIVRLIEERIKSD